jgi:hypothetical protein
MCDVPQLISSARHGNLFLAVRHKKFNTDAEETNQIQANLKINLNRFGNHKSLKAVRETPIKESSSHMAPTTHRQRQIQTPAYQHLTTTTTPPHQYVPPTTTTRLKANETPPAEQQQQRLKTKPTTM